MSLLDDDDDDDTQDDDPTAPCPACGRAIYDDAEWCPHCGKYLSREEAPAKRPWWVVAGAIVCLLIVLGWVLG